MVIGEEQKDESRCLIVWTMPGNAMWGKKEEDRFDAAVWSGRVNVTTATVRLSVLLGLAALWSGLAIWLIFFR